MKRIKKILSMILCSVVIISGNKLTLIKANAQTINKNCVYIKQVNNNIKSKGLNTEEGYKWITSVGFRLRDKIFPFSKTFWHLDLIYTNSGKLELRGNANIPKKYTFDDTFMLGCKKNGNLSVVTVFRGLNNVNADIALNKAKEAFNKANIGKDNILFIHGRDSNDSLKFESKPQPNSSYASSIIRVDSGNNYSRGYGNLDKWKIGFRVFDNELYEIKYDHSLLKKNL